MNLSDRQRQILRLMAEGMTAKDIAVQLNISYKTVETQFSNIAKKAGPQCNNRVKVLRHYYDFVEKP